MKKLSLLLAVTLLLSACDFSFSTAPTIPAPGPVSPSITLSPVPTVIPSLTPSPSTPPSSASPSPTATIPATSVQIALVDVSPAEPGPNAFGCGDNIVMVEKTNVLKQDALKSASVIAALKELFKIKQREYQFGDGMLMSALADSQVIVNSVQILNGEATVELEGYFTFGGTCDTPRVKEQIKRTIMQFPFVKSVTILLNGSEKEYECLSDQSGNCK